MGIRFSCHMCNHALHVKDFQAGKRGRCPNCNGAFRVPMKDADNSKSLDDQLQSNAGTMVAESKSKTATKADKPTRKSSVHGEALLVPPTGKGANTTADKPAERFARAPSSKPTESKKTSESKSFDTPKILETHADSKWFVRPPSGGQFGPAQTRLLLDWINERRVTGDSLIWCDGMSQWQLASQIIPECFVGSSVAIRYLPIAATPPTTTTELDAATAASTTPESVTKLDSLSEASSSSGTSQVGSVSVKKRKAKKQQLWIMISLIVVALCLLAALVYVLMNPAS